MKFLCLCEGGNVRSGQLAFWLKAAGQDAIAAGVLWNEPETIAMLAAWADVITVAEARLSEKVPESQRHKITLDFEVGPDVWGVHLIGDLRERYVPIIKEKGFYGPKVRLRYD